MDDGPFDVLDGRKVGAVATVSIADGVRGAARWILVVVGAVDWCALWRECAFECSLTFR